MLQLNNVLHVPMNRNNLFSLGSWEEVGRRFYGRFGKLLIANEGTVIARGNKVTNKLYKMKFTLAPPHKVNSCPSLAPLRPPGRLGTDVMDMSDTPDFGSFLFWAWLTDLRSTFTHLSLTACHARKQSCPRHHMDPLLSESQTQ